MQRAPSTSPLAARPAPPADSSGAGRRALAAIVATTLCAGVLYLALALWVGWDELRHAFARLGGLLAIGIPVATAAYVIRYVRWRHLLRRAGGRVPWRSGLRIYLAGFALTATPAKAGENIRSVLLLPWGVPVGASLVLFVVERFTDLIAVLFLAAATAEAAQWWWLPATALAMGFVLRVLFERGIAQRLSTRLERYPRWSWLRELLRSGAQAYVATWRGGAVLAYIAIAAAAYGMQALVFASFVQQLWPGVTVATAINIFCVSTMAGVASMLPGGLGASELTMIALLTHAGMPAPDATAAAVGTRAVTFWFGIALGVTCLASFRALARSR